MMHNRSIEIECLLVWVSWVVGLTFTIGDLFGFLMDDSGFVGLAVIGLGMWLSVMRAIRRLESRERDAFKLGCEAGPVRPLH